MASSTCILAAAVKRLLHDLKEVRDNPLPNVSCMPLEDDLFTWHGNGELLTGQRCMSCACTAASCDNGLRTVLSTEAGVIAVCLQLPENHDT